MPTPENKNLSAETQKIRDQIEKKYKKSPEELLKERDKRLWDAVQMKVPGSRACHFRRNLLCLQVRRTAVLRTIL